MNKSKLAFLAAGAATSMFIGSSVIAAEQAPAKAPAKVAEVKATANVAEVKADAKVEAPVDKWAFLPEVLAEMNGKKYTKAEITKIIDEQLAKSPYAAMITPEALQQMIPRLVNGMVEKDVLLKLAGDAGFKPSAEQVNASFDEMLKGVSKEELESVKQSLAAQNKTIESYKKEMSENKDRQEQAAIQSWVQKTIEPQIKFTDKDIAAAYEKNKAEFLVPEKVKASHILISAEKNDEPSKIAAKAKAEQILADIKAGKITFEDAAVKDSTCPSGKKDKGSLGAFSSNEMVPAFSKAAFALKKGEMSGVVETQFGFHIIRCDDKIAGQQMPLTDPKVKKYLEDTLKSEAIQKIVGEKLTEAKQKLNVKVFVKAPEAPAMPNKK